MKKRRSPRHACVQGGGPAEAGSVQLPAPAVVVIIVVLLLTAGLAVTGQTLEAIIATLAVGGLVAVELLHRTVAIFTGRVA
ncbi:hypothetical protein [Streptomyces chryseus]|uniref:hypothetical protein n=1 Tax=Streptomyces chryseus TaxID=68186 RepID=UPI00110FF486|nr:hypothetical protein [Streptomyces chryseus]GGX40725.1 hypothetical protein GCM10010353_65120 [Streptomyces chryseus]